ncbi:MAG: acylneuraminate cytidylyltransferase family protein, partial [Lachnospiraceae bacterium]|nr:acylneuraminate cytidylyltransferase family protein [Lachnospiraceae bacterium]
MDILAVIPARSGSKSVPDKNIRDIGGKPMLAYSIEHAQKSHYINRVIVSTDSEKYAGIAKKYGAEVPFLRPAEYATDTALDYDVFRHALKWLREEEGYEPELVVQLRPTYPIRRIEDIDTMVERMLAEPLADSIRTIAPAKEIPYKMWRKEESGRLMPLLTDIPECYNMPRQQLPKVYYQNACIDIFRAPCEKYPSMTFTSVAARSS